MSVLQQSDDFEQVLVNPSISVLELEEAFRIALWQNHADHANKIIHALSRRKNLTELPTFLGEVLGDAFRLNRPDVIVALLGMGASVDDAIAYLQNPARPKQTEAIEQYFKKFLAQMLLAQHIRNTEAR